MDVFDTIKDETNKGVCVVRYCGRKRYRHHSRCSRCRSRYEALIYPERTCYNKLRSNAKRRGKDFEISYEYFVEVCRAGGYFEGRGRTGDKLTIDRINPNYGYVHGNIRIMIQAENSSNKRNDYEYKPNNDKPDDSPF